MVDALHRAHRVLAAGGCVIDIHPTPKPARLEVLTGTQFVGLADRLDDGTESGPMRRHMAADAAVASCVSSGLFTREAATDFTFRTHADSVEELLEYLRAKWKQLHFAAFEMACARDWLTRDKRHTVVVTERVTASRLAPRRG